MTGDVIRFSLSIGQKSFNPRALLLYSLSLCMRAWENSLIRKIKKPNLCFISFGCIRIYVVSSYQKLRFVSQWWKKKTSDWFCFLEFSFLWFITSEREIQIKISLFLSLSLSPKSPFSLLLLLVIALRSDYKVSFVFLHFLDF